MDSTSPLDHRGRHRVAVTGLGVKTPAGITLDAFWQTILAGKSVAHRITLFDPSELTAQFACEVPEFHPENYFEPKELRRLDRVTQLGTAAAIDALKMAGDIDADPARCGVFTGCGVGGFTTIQEQVILYAEKGASRVSPMLIPMMMSNATAGTIGIQVGWTGPNMNIATACAASANSIGEATRLIQHGETDVMLAGGCEAGVTAVGVASFARMGALSSRNEAPELASRPFDADRDGFVLGEGATFLVLERWDHAVDRGAEIIGEVMGYGRNADAHHITAPSPGGAGAAACMQAALDDAGLVPSDIGHINAHGTSTPLNDAAEEEAISKVFGDDAPPVTSTKGVTGHLIGAAGATEAAISLLAMRDHLIPPTANFHRPDDGVRIDIVHGAPREVSARPVASNSFGFGGHNGTLILGPAR